MQQWKKQYNRHNMAYVFGAIVLVPVFLYIAVQIFVIFHHSYRTETAIVYTMSNTVNLTGVAVFDAVDVAGSGNLGYLVSDGERVTIGTTLAEKYTNDQQGLMRERLDRLNRNINLMTKSQNSVGSDLSVLTSETNAALYNLLEIIDTADYSGIDAAEDTFLLAQNRLQISTGQSGSYETTIAAMETERNALREILDKLETVEADTNGYFVCAEAAPAIAPDREQLEEGSAVELKDLLDNQRFPAANQNRAGRIITGFGWYFYGVCDLAAADKLEQVSKVSIGVPGKSTNSFGAVVQEVTRDEEAGLAKVVLLCQSINASIVRFGVENVQITLNTYEGIRIEKEALHIVDGENGVYVKYGNLQKFRKISKSEILYEDDKYVLIGTNGALKSENEVRLYDEIIVEGTNLQDGKLL